MCLVDGEAPRMKTLLLGCVVLALLTVSACGQRGSEGSPPTLEHDRIIFQNGRKITFEDDKIYLQNNLKRIEVSRPVTVVERAFVVEKWKRVIVETKYGYFEDLGLVYRFYDYEGKLLNKTREYFGEFKQLLMIEVDRYVLVQTSAHYALREGYILDPDGNQIGTIKQRPDAYTAFATKEGDLFVIQYSRRRAGVPFWTVEALDIQGNVLTSTDFKSGGSYVIEVGERKIPISLRDPS
jgi:hypothetical protein